MKTTLHIIILTLLLLILSSPISAQETQIPVDEEGRIEYIDTELERKLGLFSDYVNFREARLFQVSDTLFVLEIYYQPEGKLLKDRLLYSDAEMSDFRRKVTAHIRREIPAAELNQEGRTKLIVGSLALSMGYYGWAVPMVFEVQDPKVIVALYMLTSGTGFYLPLSATRDVPVTDAAATLSIYGGTRGLVHGMSLGWFLSNNPSAQGIVFSGMAVSIAEGIAGFNFATKSGMSAGSVETIGVGGDFGVGLGLGMAHLAGFLDESSRQAAAGSVLLGSGLGIWGGNWLSERQSYTRGDAYVLSAAGLLGAYIPIAIVDFVAPDKEKAYTAGAMLGATVGLAVGDRLLQGKDFTTGQGVLIRLSEVAGGLLGAGLAYLVSNEDADNSTLYYSSSAIGATAGFWYMYRSYKPSAETAAKEFSWNFSIRPEGLIALAISNRIDYDKYTPPHLLNLNFRF